MIKNNETLVYVFEHEFELIKNNPEEFWKGIKKIGNESFIHSDTLEDIIIPEGITEIGDFAFASCENLRNITLPSTLTKIGSQVFFESGIETIILPTSLQEVGNNIFGKCDKLTSVTIPEKFRDASNDIIGNNSDFISVKYISENTSDHYMDL